MNDNRTRLRKNLLKKGNIKINNKKVIQFCSEEYSESWIIIYCNDRSAV